MRATLSNVLNLSVCGTRWHAGDATMTKYIIEEPGIEIGGGIKQDIYDELINEKIKFQTRY
jgi:hypothetical protein